MLESRDGERALVLRNATGKEITVEAAFADLKGQQTMLWRPGRAAEPVRLPARLTLPPFGAAVILALAGQAASIQQE